MVLIILFLALLAGIGVLLMFRVKQHEADKAKVPTPTPIVQAANPPLGINNIKEETFDITNGFARSFDQNDISTWKSATNVQIRGKISSWSSGQLIVTLGGGTLTLKTTDPIRYYCFPLMVPGANGAAAVKTSTIYTPIRTPETTGKMVPLSAIATRLRSGDDTHIVATRDGDWLKATLVAGYGCGYPADGAKINE